MPDAIDHRSPFLVSPTYFIVSPDERALYELPSPIYAAEAEAWLVACQEDGSLPWSATLFYGTEAAAYDLMAGLIAAMDPHRPRWNA